MLNAENTVAQMVLDALCGSVSGKMVAGEHAVAYHLLCTSTL